MSWYDTILVYAQRAAKALNMPVSVVLAQWANESARGTSQLAKNANNLGGIKYVGQKEADGKYGAFAKYDTFDDFVNDYIRVMSFNYYKPVRDAVSPVDTINALAKSPYAEGGYTANGIPGQALINILNGDALTKYDNPSTINNGSTIPIVPSGGNLTISPEALESVKKYAPHAMIIVGGIIILGLILSD